MANNGNKKGQASDRSMDAEHKDARPLFFFFPKRNPPVSVRAATREEAERILEGTNHTEV